MLDAPIPLRAKCDDFRLWALLPIKLGFSRGQPLEAQEDELVLVRFRVA